MPNRRLPTRSVAATTLFAWLFGTAVFDAPATASAAAATASSPAATATPGAPRARTEVFQQRGANGGIVLTDRPSPSRTTERVWQIEREDPVAAEQRADAVRREAQAVSDRVQRRLEAQRRLSAEVDLQRGQLDADERERRLELARIEAEQDRAPFLYSPYGYAPGPLPGLPFDQAPLVREGFGQGRYAEPRIGERRAVGPRVGERRIVGPRIGERSDAGPRVGEGRFDPPRLGLPWQPDAGRSRPPRQHPHAAPGRAGASGQADLEEK